MTRVVAASRHYQIEALSKLEVPPISPHRFYVKFSEFKNDVDFVTMQIRIGAAQFNRSGSVQLDVTMKRKIHHFVQQIRDLIELAELSPDKKDDLLSKLNKFAAEIDRGRTRLQAGMDFYIAVCNGIGVGFKKLKPVKDMIDSIGNVLGDAKQLEDQFTKKLPPARDRKRLEPPKERTETPSGEIDDHISF